MHVSTKILIALGVLVLAAGLAIGGWQLGWWLKGAAVNRNTAILQHSDERQRSYIAEIQRNEADIRTIDSQIALSPESAATLRAQQVAIRQSMCNLATFVVNPPAQIATIIGTECS